MTYIFDSGPFIDMRSYFPEIFPTFWELMSENARSGVIISTREVINELKRSIHDDFLEDWITENRDIFKTPSGAETEFVRNLFSVRHFQHAVRKEHILSGLPVADPWVIALANQVGGVVVTREKYKDNSANIPNICEHFGIAYTDFPGFLKSMEWRF